MAAAAFIGAASLYAFAADAPAAPCGPDTAWADFSRLKLTVDAEGGPRGAPFRLQIEHTVHDDGIRIVGTDDGKRTEVIVLRRAGGRAVLASAPTAVREFGEIGTVYEVPLAALKGSFHNVCELRDNASHPVALRQGGESLAGSVRLDSDTIRFDLKESGAHGRFSYVGSIDYHRPRGALPASLPVAGWTVFTGASSAPEDGVPSKFRTLGDFEDSLSR